MADANEAKKKALQLTLDKLDKTYGKGAVMKMGDDKISIVILKISRGNRQHQAGETTQCK